MTQESTPESPCIGICHVDPASGLCRGCGRSLPEIASWLRLNGGERRSIMATLPQRMREAGLEPPPGSARSNAVQAS